MSNKDDTPKRHHVLQTLAERLGSAAEMPVDEVLRQLRPPPNPEMGDYAFPCFAMAKKRKMPPPKLAQELAESLSGDSELQSLFTNVEAAGPFLNFRARAGVLCAAILSPIHKRGASFAHSSTGNGRSVVVDYSAPNIAKPFHVGHLMSTILGASLVRIFRAQGYEVVGVNHLGDWGTQCGFQFLAWQRADEKKREEELERRGIDYLVDLYVDINAPGKELKSLKARLAGKDEALSAEQKAELESRISNLEPEVEEIDSEARALFKRLEEGDAELRALWERMRERTLAVLQKSYDRLGISFESDAGEAFYEPLLKPMIEDLRTRGVLEESEGAWVIPLTEPGAKKKKPPFIIIKSDGATKYETRDLAAAIYRKKTYDFAQNLYVVDVRQSEHFAGLFKALGKAGYEWAPDCHHVSYGMMQIKEGDATLPMTTRGGRMIPLGELLDRMVGIVRGIVEEKNPSLSNQRKDQVAEAVGVGAIVFWVQSRRRTSNIVFDWKLATDPQGDTGPYVQYTHARSASILRKHGEAVPSDADLSALEQPEEVAVAKALERFPSVIQDAAKGYEPSIITSWLIETARAFNDFYNKHQVLKAEPKVRDARLVLVDAVRRQIAEGLQILGIAAPEEM